MGDWDFVLVSLLFVDDEHEYRRKKIHSQYRKDFLQSLDIAEPLDLVYRINLRASGVRCMKLRMIWG